jgi:chromosome segregation ATPase
VKQQGGDVGELRTLVVQLDAKVDRRIDGLDGRFEAIDRRFEAVDRRFDAIDQRFAAIDRRFHDLEGLIASLDQKLSRQFLWTMGVLTTVFVSVIGTLLGVVLTLD